MTFSATALDSLIIVTDLLAVCPRMLKLFSTMSAISLTAVSLRQRKTHTSCPGGKHCLQAHKARYKQSLEHLIQSPFCISSLLRIQVVPRVEISESLSVVTSLKSSRLLIFARGASVVSLQA